MLHTQRITLGKVDKLLMGISLSISLSLPLLSLTHTLILLLSWTIWVYFMYIYAHMCMMNLIILHKYKCKNLVVIVWVKRESERERENSIDRTFRFFFGLNISSFFFHHQKNWFFMNFYAKFSHKFDRIETCRAIYVHKIVNHIKH